MSGEAAVAVPRVARLKERARWVRSGDDWCVGALARRADDGAAARRHSVSVDRPGANAGERAFRILGDRLAARGVSSVPLQLNSNGKQTGEAIRAGGVGPQPRRAVVQVDRRRRGACDAARARRGDRTRRAAARRAAGVGGQPVDAGYRHALARSGIPRRVGQDLRGRRGCASRRDSIIATPTSWRASIL